MSISSDRLPYEIADIEMPGKACPQRRGGERRKMRKAAEMRHAADVDNDALGCGILDRGEHDTEQRYSAGAQGLDRQQAMVDRTKRGAGAKHYRRAPPRDDIDIEDFACQRHQQPARRLDDQRPDRIRQNQCRGIDGNAIEFGGKVRRCRRLQPIGLGQNALGGEAGQPKNRFAVGLLLEAGLNRLPIEPVQSTRERGCENSFADAGVSAGYNYGRDHAVLRMSSARASNKSATTASLTFNVSAMRRRAVPSGTVGGRIARTS